MSRGKASKPGDTRVSANGYHYTRTQTDWRLTHHIIAEKRLGRSLKDDERVVFRDGKRSNLESDNLMVVPKGSASTNRTRARLTARIAELQAKLSELS